ncbi:MAG: hypothetical protein IJ867_06740 [Clostridia bacterium]|nr:hypothetical protein [Clostridia bacterium]
MRRNEKHVSEQEKKRNMIMYILVAILIIILLLIVIIMFPKGNNNNEVTDTTAQNSGSRYEDDTENSVNEVETIQRNPNKVSITVNQDTLSEDGAVITIMDTNTNPYKWAPKYTLEEEIDGEWVKMELKNPENAIFPDTETENPDGYMEQSLVWSNKYGKLESGKKYRIVKISEGTEFYAEFELD